MPSTAAPLADPSAPAAGGAPWLKCRSCGRPLVRISVREGVTVLALFEDQFWIRDAIVRCGCGAERSFRSMRVLGHV